MYKNRSIFLSLSAYTISNLLLVWVFPLRTVCYCIIETLCCSHYSGTCLSFSCENKNLFVVGSENGGIFKCSVQSTTISSVDKTTGM